MLQLVTSVEPASAYTVDLGAAWGAIRLVLALGLAAAVLVIGIVFIRRFIS